MIFENIKLALSSISKNKIRSVLTMLGIIIGVSSVVTIVSIGEGFKQSIASSIDELGSRLIVINPGQTVIRDENGEIDGFNAAGSFGASTLSEKDIADIRALDTVEAAAPQMIITGTVNIGEKEVEGGFITATNTDYPIAFNQEIRNGDFFSDKSTNSRQAVIGNGINELYFGNKNPLGTKLSIRGETFIIVGVMEEFKVAGGLEGLGPDINKAVLIPFAAGKELSNDIVFISEVEALAASEELVDQAAKDITETLKKNHGGEEDFTVIKQEEVLAITDSIFDIATLFVAMIAGISIVVGGIGIMNIMLVNVTERTREIGLRKAVGATESQILTQFLIEAVVLTLVGGLIGVAIAYIAGLIIAAQTDITPDITTQILLFSLGGSAVIGAASGLWPAFKAAAKHPIDALRYE